MLAWVHRLRGRLLLGSVVPVILFVGTALVGSFTIQRLLEALERERQSTRVLALASDLKATLAVLESAKRGVPLARAGRERADQRAAFDKARKALDVPLEELGRLAAADPSQAELTAEVRRRVRDWSAAAAEDVALCGPDLIVGGNEWRHVVRLLQARATAEPGRPAREAVADLIDRETELLEQRRDQVRRTTAESVWAIGLALAGAVVLAVLIPLQLARGITRPVDELRAATDDLRRGQYRTVTPAGPDEIARLMTNFNLTGLALAAREDLLRTSERRYQGLLSGQQQLLYTVGPDGRISECDNWMAFSGLTEDEVRAGRVADRIHPDDRDRVEARWREAREARAVYEDEYRARRHDGVYRVLSCRCVPIVDARDNLIEWVGACVDVTERRQQESLRTQAEAAEAANRAKDAFLRRMSHELRTPLNAILGMAKMLGTERFGPLNEKQADYLRDILRSGDHLLVLIDTLLDLAGPRR